jgi:hypothetical protein
MKVRGPAGSAGWLPLAPPRPVLRVGADCVTRRLHFGRSQLNIAYPSTGCQKVIEVDDENKL